MRTLRANNPSLFQTTCTAFCVHSAVALDFALGGEQRHSTGAWKLVAIAPVSVWALLHVLIAAGLAFGVFRHHLVVLRLSFAGSTLIFSALAGSFLYGALTKPDAAFFGSILCAALATLSLVAATAPDPYSHILDVGEGVSGPLLVTREQASRLILHTAKTPPAKTPPKDTR